MGLFDGILLASDFDRTLTDTHSAIPQKNIDAIRYFMSEGGRFTVATGRSVPMYLHYRDAVPVNAPYILYNGAAFYDFGTAVLSGVTEIPGGIDVLREIIRMLPDLRVEVQGIDYHYLIGECPMRDEFYRHNSAPFTHAEPEDIPLPVLKIALYGEFYDPTVARLFISTPEEKARIDRACAELNERFGGVLVIDRAADRIIDIQEKTVSKGAAARKLADTLGCRTLVCAGDAFNDLSMLLEADYAFAPADCDASVAGRGFRYVCPCDGGALADVVAQLRRICAK